MNSMKAAEDTSRISAVIDAALRALEVVGLQRERDARLRQCPAPPASRRSLSPGLA